MTHTLAQWWCAHTVWIIIRDYAWISIQVIGMPEDVQYIAMLHTLAVVVHTMQRERERERERDPMTSSWYAFTKLWQIHIILWWCSLSRAENIRLFSGSEHGIVLNLHGLRVHLVSQGCHQFVHVKDTRWNQHLRKMWQVWWVYICK